MPICFASYLQSQLKTLVAAEGFDLDPEVRQADERFGDLQANGMLSYAKKTHKTPQNLAKRIQEAFQKTPLAEKFESEVSGPGFINFRLTKRALIDWLQEHFPQKLLQQAFPYPCSSKRVLIDYSSPNSAKEMHVGHLRSLILGESLRRLFRFTDASVISDNHLGDWGTQFGILLLAIKEKKLSPEAVASLELRDLENLYREGMQLSQTSPEKTNQARHELFKLQNGDPQNTQLWTIINQLSYASFETIYQRLGVRFDHVFGESFYADKVQQVYEELVQYGIAVESQGALVVFHPEHPRFSKIPFIVRKADGASNYASTDLATILFRTEVLETDHILYVTDGRQKDHFEQLFLTAQKWFAATQRSLPKLQHVAFGMILGNDRKAIKTRSGESIKLNALLDESVQRAYQLVCEKNSALEEFEKKAIAENIGINAIRYADLLQNRALDYTFNWDKLLAFEGNTAPYLLYTGARIHALCRKAHLDPKDLKPTEIFLESPSELALARKLIQFPQAVTKAIENLEPHWICHYLYELCSTFSTFYNAERIFCEPPELQKSRLFLCVCTLEVLERLLGLLGISTLEKM